MITLFKTSTLLTMAFIFGAKFTRTDSQYIFLSNSQKSFDNIADSILSKFVGTTISGNSDKKKVFILKDTIIFKSNSNFDIKNVIKINDSKKVPYKKGTYKIEVTSCDYINTDSSVERIVTYELIKRVKKSLWMLEGYYTFRIYNNLNKSLLTISLEGGIKPIILFEGGG